MVKGKIAIEKFLKSGLSLTFKGGINFALVDSIMAMLYEKLDAIEKSVSTRKKVYGVINECLQNLCFHVDNASENRQQIQNSDYDSNTVFFDINDNSGYYTIYTANFIPNKNISAIDQWLSKINDATPKELKKIYNSLLTDKTFSNKGTAGLGFVDMARKSGRKFDYSFEQVDDNYSLFLLNITIPKDNKAHGKS